VNQVLGEPSNGGFDVVKSSNEFVVSCQVVTISPFQVAEDEVKGITIRHKISRISTSTPIANCAASPLSVTIAQMSAVIGIRAVSFFPVSRCPSMAQIFMSLLALGMLMEMCYIDLQPQGRVR
jgi:hypothetical protein